MSKNIYQQNYLSGIDTSVLSTTELDDTFMKILTAGIHGISFSAYLENQQAWFHH